jgi:hypothetical protein
MNPFNFLGQDSGTLVNYYLDVIRTNISIPGGYVILSGQSGEALIYISQEAFESGQRQTTQSFVENTVYRVNFGGDFLGLADENTYRSVISKQDIFGAIQDSPDLLIRPSGYASGIQLDRPIYELNFSGEIESGNIDIVPYLFIINSGKIRNVLVDKSAYLLGIESGYLSGCAPDEGDYSVNFAGQMTKIYDDELNFSLSFLGGTARRGSVEQNIDSGEGFDLSLTFIGGSVYGPG